MNKLRESIELAGLSFKKEVIILAILNALFLTCGLLIILLLKKPLYIAFVIFFAVIVDYLCLSRYKTILVNKNADVELEFISLLPFFRTYLKNDFSVYQSLKELVSFSSPILMDRLNKLIEEIDTDKSITPFINFALTFKSNNIEQLMISIYQMIDEGNNSPYLIQFESIFSKLRDDYYKTLLEKKEKGLSNMSMYPLIGSGLLIVMISFGVIQVIGDMINGL